MLYCVRPGFLFRCLYPSALFRISSGEKKIFLTFDDGPTAEVTLGVLSVLKKYGAKATFFCTGENIEKEPGIFRQIVSEGHAVGNHTYSHLNGWKTKTKDYLEDVEKCKTTIVKWLNAYMVSNSHSAIQPFNHSTINHNFFRPPYGKMKLSQYSILNTRPNERFHSFGRAQYSIIMWDVLSGDFDEGISKEKCLRQVLAKVRAGSIVVFHDSLKAKEKLLFVLPRVIEHFGEEGYEFAKLFLVTN